MIGKLKKLAAGIVIVVMAIFYVPAVVSAYNQNIEPCQYITDADREGYREIQHRGLVEVVVFDDMLIYAKPNGYIMAVTHQVRGYAFDNALIGGDDYDGCVNGDIIAQWTNKDKFKTTEYKHSDGTRTKVVSSRGKIFRIIRCAPADQC